MRKVTAALFAGLLLCLSACGEPTGGGGKEPMENFDDRDPSMTAEEDGGTSESTGLTPKTEVLVCEIQNGLPVAEVKVTNSTDEASAFSVQVQFRNGDEVLGTGLEYTQTLKPGQNQTVRMGNMQGDAEAVDTCEVLEATASTD